MSGPENHDEWLDALLKQQTPYIDDDGFTERVASKLPPRRSPKQRYLIIGLFAALSGVAVFFLPVGELIQSALKVPEFGKSWPMASVVVLVLIAWAVTGLVRSEDA